MIDEMDLSNLQVQPVSFSCPYLKLLLDDISMSKMARRCVVSGNTGNVFRAGAQQCYKASHLLVSLGQLPFILCQGAPCDSSSYLDIRATSNHSLA